MLGSNFLTSLQPMAHEGVTQTGCESEAAPLVADMARHGRQWNLSTSREASRHVTWTKLERSRRHGSSPPNCSGGGSTVLHALPPSYRQRALAQVEALIAQAERSLARHPAETGKAETRDRLQRERRRL